MDATRSEDAPNESQFQEMDPERRQFLEEALKSMTVNVVDELETAVKTIMNDASSEDQTLNAIEVITDYVQEIDAANDFFKVGGFCILDRCLSSSHTSVKSASLRLIKELAQNNPFCQEKLLEHGILNKLIELLSDPSSDQVSCDAMSAISALVRAYEPGLKAFLDVGGLECMLGCIGDDSRLKLQIRVAFLISTITAETPSLAKTFIQLDAVERLTEHLTVLTKEELNGEEEKQIAEVSRLENFLSALSTLTATEEGLGRCVVSGGELKSKLEMILKSVQGREEQCQEVIDFSKEILKRIEGNKKNNNINNKDEADR